LSPIFLLKGGNLFSFIDLIFDLTILQTGERDTLRKAYDNLRMTMICHFIYSNKVLSCSIKYRSMTDVHNKDKDHSPVPSNTSNSPLQDEELLKVLKALGSEGFRFIEYHEN
jgi:hypothetical protein